MNIDIFKKSWFWIIILAAALLLMQLFHVAPMPKLNQLIYDTSLKLIHKSPGSADKIALVSIPQHELIGLEEKLNTKQAITRLLQSLSKAHVKSVGVLIPLADKQEEAGLAYLSDVEAYLKEVELSPVDNRALRTIFNDARKDIDVDALLSKQIARSHHVFFPFHISDEVSPEPDFLHYYVLPTQAEQMPQDEGFIQLLPPQQELPVIYKDAWPLSDFVKAARGLGYLSQWVDADHHVRSVQLAHAYANQWVASLPLVLAANSLNLRIKDIEFTPHVSVRLANKVIPLDHYNRMYLSFYTSLDESQPVFPHYTYQQIISGDISPRDLRDKVILVDAPDAYHGDDVMTPIGKLSGIAELTAHAMTSILNNDVYKRPASFLWLELGLLVLVALYLTLLLPRLRLITGALVSLFMLFILFGVEEYLLLSQQAWLFGGASILLLLLGYSFVGVQAVYKALSAKHADEMAYTNRQLGLMLQEKGKLEQAFEYLQKLPPKKENLELIYNLALDFERKRKFNNAASAYQYILALKPNFKDVSSKVIMAEKMQHSVTMGTGQFSTMTSLLTDGDEKPMLGRFVIEKELGRGAMGAVYLGRDPKIDRVVAVKTLALAEEFDSTEIREVEHRFFHEASAAGRLNHPNIVTIYDAAEDHDLAYIAMEYIEGKPLDDFAKKGHLLPVPVVLNIIAKIADALDYAGKKEIVHRDIKPANIMYNEEGNIVKVTDFGIARIASTGRTKTGMILGTPSYMSPEQMNGEKVDSRSDIFSLGVTMFVLLTGEKPFAGDSLAAISYKIVNEKHPDILTVRKDLPDCVKNIINKALHKNPEKRYQNGGVMRRALVRCLKTLVDS